MTREQAEHVITDALAGIEPQSDLAFAHRIAIALDATGLLNFAAAWERISPHNRRLASQSAGEVAAEAIKLLAERDRIISAAPKWPTQKGDD